VKTSITIATFLVLSAGAASAGAIVNPYQGSDTLFNVTTDAINKAAFSNAAANPYVGGGSGNGQTAMLNSASTNQVTAPMSKMLTNGICSATVNVTNASGIVIGLDAVDVMAGSATSCPAPIASGSEGGVCNFSTWKDVLKIIYGGEANPNDSAHFLCNGSCRTFLVANWSNIFGANNPVAGCNDATHTASGHTGGMLWHAFRRDEASGTSDVFSSIIGIAPSTSVSSVNGFGVSPYCNAMNWDATSANANCTGGTTKQFLGPGGVDVGDGIHRQPPPGVWGTTPQQPVPAADAAWDVLPTSYQDNDPIRRPCLGLTLGNLNRAAEDVCNLDGNLGLVLAVPTTDYIAKAPPAGDGLLQYPTGLNGTTFAGCNGNSFQVAAPGVLTCPVKTGAAGGRTHGGQCPDGDSKLFGGACLAKAANAGLNNATGTQCLASPSQIPTIHASSTVTTDGRVQNMFMFNGQNQGAYIQQIIPTATGTISLDSVQGIGRIHTASVVPGSPTPVTPCQMSDATDEIGCIVQADPCSIGFAGDGAKSWGQRHVGSTVASNNCALNIDGVAPGQATVQLLGKQGEYELARKLYLNTVAGFTAVQGFATDPDQFTLATDEGNAEFITPIIIADGFFNVGQQSPSGQDSVLAATDPTNAGKPFCEDFNQNLLCGATLDPTNDNACGRNPAGIPADPSTDPTVASTSTVCGNGKIDAYEECDSALAIPANQNGPSHGCSTTCRCVANFGLNTLTGTTTCL
jgi:hypothetical protein